VRRLHLLVEGITEKVVADHLLVPYLTSERQYVTVSVCTTKRPAAGGHHKGGVSRWSKLRAEIANLLSDSSIEVLSTLFDYYGFPADSPGMRSRPSGSSQAAVEHVESAIRGAIADARFRPHLVLHELEAWVLAARLELGKYLGATSLADALDRVVGDAGGPENVNDGPATSPSHRLLNTCPGYSKAQDGPAVLRRAGLAVVVEQCPHAAAWIESLRA